MLIWTKFLSTRHIVKYYDLWWSDIVCVTSDVVEWKNDWGIQYPMTILSAEKLNFHLLGACFYKAWGEYSERVRITKSWMVKRYFQFLYLTQIIVIGNAPRSDWLKKTNFILFSLSFVKYTSWQKKTRLNA